MCQLADDLTKPDPYGNREMLIEHPELLLFAKNLSVQSSTIFAHLLFPNCAELLTFSTASHPIKASTG